MKEDLTGRIRVLRAEIHRNPGAAQFPELATLLAADAATRPEAREICFRGLKENPSNTVGRLTLARLFYLDGLAEFAVRELVELRRYAAAPSLDKLIRSFGPLGERYLDVPLSSVPETNETAEADVVAEIDIEGDFMDALEELEQEKK